MYAVKIATDGTANLIDFTNDSRKQYEIMSSTVDGYIERVGIVIHGRQYDMWVNEEGLLRRLPYNSIATYFYEDTWKAQGLIVGDVLITKGNNEGDTLPLLMTDVNEVMAGVHDYKVANLLDPA